MWFPKCFVSLIYAKSLKYEITYTVLKARCTDVKKHKHKTDRISSGSQGLWQ